jgi:hypothetical protein
MTQGTPTGSTAAPQTGLDDLPGFRRRVRITPAGGSVCAEVEDDYHHMAVTLHHMDGVAANIDATIHRAPWSTCPGAEARLRQTFSGVALAGFPIRGEKQANCTHLHDLAILAAAHAGVSRPIIYDILVSDPDGGIRRAEIRRDGTPVFTWTLAGMTIRAPAEAAGQTLLKLGAFLETLDPPGLEAAKLLRWGSLIAHGRSIPIEQQSDASRMPPNCFTFQPAMAAQARRVGVIRDFRPGGPGPLDAC